jgi:hypothetical protein
LSPGCKIFPILGSAIATVGLFLLSTMGPDTGQVTSGLYMVVLGAGLGLVMQTVVLATQNTVERTDIGVGTSTVTFSRQVGASVGVAVFGAVFNNRLSAELADRLPHGAKTPATSSISRKAIDVFRYAVPFLAIAFVGAFFLKEEPLRGGPAVEVSTEPSAERLPVH